MTSRRLPPYNPRRRQQIETGMQESGTALPASRDGLIHMWKDAPGNKEHPEGIVVALCGNGEHLAGHWDVIDCEDCRRIGEEEGGQP